MRSNANCVHGACRSIPMLKRDSAFECDWAGIRPTIIGMRTQMHAVQTHHIASSSSSSYGRQIDADVVGECFCVGLCTNTQYTNGRAAQRARVKSNARTAAGTFSFECAGITHTQQCQRQLRRRRRRSTFGFASQCERYTFVVLRFDSVRFACGQTSIFFILVRQRVSVCLFYAHMSVFGITHCIHTLAHQPTNDVCTAR